jgi:YfiH family protein
MQLLLMHGGCAADALAVSDYTGMMPNAAKTSRVRRAPGKPAPRHVPEPKISSPWSVRTVQGVPILELAPFKKFPWLVHGFSTRIGGASVLDSGERVLNLGFTEWDHRETVLKNRQTFQSALGASNHTLVPLKQIHSSVVRVVPEMLTNLSRQSSAYAGALAQTGDASLTNSASLLLGIQTADCVPIFLVDAKKRAVGAIHAGWRGTLAGIAEKTVGEMRKQFGSKPADILAALGPAIGGCCYAVGTELVTEFTSQFADAEQYFDELRTGEEPNPLQWLNMMPPGHQPPPKNVRLDLRKANRAQLLAAGLRDANIFVSDLCTACHSSLFFSYREERANSGRMLSAIGLHRPHVRQ